jgi:hypothetical protein
MEFGLTTTVIDIRITISGPGEVKVSSAAVTTSSERPLVERQADNFLPRLGDKNKTMVRAFITQDGLFTFDDIAAETGETYGAIKMRHFNLGPTINKVAAETGEDFVLIEDVDYVQTTSGKRTKYKVPTALRDELRSRKF